MPTDRALDGASFLPALRGEPIRRSKPLYWQFNRAKGKAKVAIRQGDWKLVASLDVPDPKPSGGIPENEMQLIKSAGLVDFELYNLDRDIAESIVVSDDNAKLFADLKKQMEEMYAEVREEAPHWPAWEWAKYESKRIQWPDYWLNRKRK